MNDAIKKLKRGASRLLPQSGTVASFLEGIITSLSLWKAGHAIEGGAYRHLRVRVLRRGIRALREAMGKTHYTQGLLLRDGEEYAVSEGILLNLRGTNRYLKVVGDEAGNEGKRSFEFLSQNGIAINSMIDLGANFGEMSLYFCKQRPNARILSVEASSDNFRILQSNCRAQYFSTKNITLLNEAVSDRKGFVSITKGINPENIVIHPHVHLKKEDMGDSAPDTEQVPSDTLDSLLKRFHVTEVDFLKIDIEGSEPLLLESFKTCLPQIKSILIEVGDKADHERYFPLLTLLWNHYKGAYDHEDGRRFKTLQDLEKKVLSSYAMDVWFVKKMT